MGNARQHRRCDDRHRHARAGDVPQRRGPRTDGMDSGGRRGQTAGGGVHHPQRADPAAGREPGRESAAGRGRRRPGRPHGPDREGRGGAAIDDFGGPDPGCGGNDDRRRVDLPGGDRAAPADKSSDDHPNPSSPTQGKVESPPERPFPHADLSRLSPRMPPPPRSPARTPPSPPPNPSLPLPPLPLPPPLLPCLLPLLFAASPLLPFPSTPSPLPLSLAEGHRTLLPPPLSPPPPPRSPPPLPSSNSVQRAGACRLLRERHGRAALGRAGRDHLEGQPGGTGHARLQPGGVRRSPHRRLPRRRGGDLRHPRAVARPGRN